jgi:hypothetical protein
VAAHDPDAHQPTAEQYREWAKLVRRQVETLNNANVRRHLLRIAERYEELADSLDRSRWG